MEICKPLVFLQKYLESINTCQSNFVDTSCGTVQVWNFKVAFSVVLPVQSYFTELGDSIQKLGHHQFGRWALDSKSTKPLFGHLYILRLVVRVVFWNRRFNPFTFIQVVESSSCESRVKLWKMISVGGIKTLSISFSNHRCKGKSFRGVFS